MAGRTRGKKVEYEEQWTEPNWDEGLDHVNNSCVNFSEKSKKVLADGCKVWNFACRCGAVARLQEMPDGTSAFMLSVDGHTDDCSYVNNNSEEGTNVTENEPLRGLSKLQKKWMRELFMCNFNTVGKCESRMLALQRAGNIPTGCTIPCKKKMKSFWPRLSIDCQGAGAYVKATPQDFETFAEHYGPACLPEE